MKILCVCTGGKDRSPVMAKYLRDRGHDAYAVGINKSFTDKHGTRLIEGDDLLLSNVVIVVSKLHAVFVRGMLRCLKYYKHHPPIIVVPLDKRHKNMSREEFISWVRAAMDKKIKMIERE